MNSVPPEPADLVNRLRQQLILAQVRIMELEDVRDGLSPRLAELELLLREAQSIADGKLDESAHLAKVLADTRTHGEELNRLQEQTARELESCRAALAESVAQLGQCRETLAKLETGLENAKSEAAIRLTRIGQLEAELRGVRFSRSWRWTAWLRMIGRLFSRPGT
ncbi:MAG: hypothetical protein ACHQ5A_03375 [Opitutales bacterium]